MKEDKKQSGDQVEKWLHQTVGDYRPEAPDNTWERLVPYLPKRKKRRFFLFWWVPSGIAAALFVAFLLHSAGEPPQTTQNATDANADIFSAEDQKSVAATIPGSSPESSVPQLEKQHHQYPVNAVTANGNPAPLQQLTPTENVPVLTISGIDLPIISKASGSIGLNLLEKPFPVFITSTQPEAGMVRHELNGQPRRIRQKRIRIGLDLAPAVFIQKIGSEHVSGLVFPEMPAHPGLGWQAGVSLGLQLHKNWWLSTGIQHLRQTHHARHLATLRLMDGVLLNPHDPGLKEYEFQYAVISSGRPSALTLRLQQEEPGPGMPADEPFTLDMKTIRHTASWRIPLMVERQFSAQKWRGFLRGGAILDLTESTTLQVTHFTEICQDLCFANGHIPMVHSTSSGHNAIGWVAGAGIERQISPRTVFRVEPLFVGQKQNLQCSLHFGVQFTY